MGTALITTGPLKKALVNKLRANSAIRAATVGGFHEGLNASKTVKYPHVVFNLVAAPYNFAWGSAMLQASFDIVVRGPDPAEVNSLDALITEELNDSTLSVTGPGDVDLTTLNLRREEELPLSPERNAMGQKIFQNGADYSIWVDHKTE